MDWTSIILALLGGTSVAGIVEAVRYRRQNMKLKDAEATTADTEAQEKQMNLAESYLEKVLALTEKGNVNQDEIIRRLEALDGRIDNIEAYLNGEFKDWKKRRSK